MHRRRPSRSRRRSSARERNVSVAPEPRRHPRPDVLGRPVRPTLDRRARTNLGSSRSDSSEATRCEGAASIQSRRSCKSEGNGRAREVRHSDVRTPGKKNPALIPFLSSMSEIHSSSQSETRREARRDKLNGNAKLAQSSDDASVPSSRAVAKHRTVGIAREASRARRRQVKGFRCYTTLRCKQAVGPRRRAKTQGADYIQQRNKQRLGESGKCERDRRIHDNR